MRRLVHSILLCFIILHINGVVAQTKSSNTFNPDISANFLGLWGNGSAISDDPITSPHRGFSLQETEFQFAANVDPYSKAVMTFAIAQEDGEESYSIDPEEVYLETISLPNVTLRAGKFKLAVGKHNQLHTHAFPFIDAPLIHQQLLGDEGLNESGVSASFLFPTSWYSEVIVQAFSLRNEKLFGSEKSSDTGGLLKFKNLWDLNQDLTLEFGTSGMIGKNRMDKSSSVIAADLTFKWRPAEGGKYQAFIWSTEYLQGDRKGTVDANGKPLARLGGLASWLQYQFAERWWVQTRYEYLGIVREDVIPFQTKQSLLLGFFPSEFSGLKLQYDHITTQGSDSQYAILLQYSISIGSHPAHAY